ncbi:MAG: hypothetical protein ACYC7D_06315 [Nitrososphaerales archaeon]
MSERFIFACIKARLLVRVSIKREIKASKEFIFDWWIDLSPEDANLVRPLKRRKIISKSSTLIILEAEEEMYLRRMKFNVKVILERPNK